MRKKDNLKFSNILSFQRQTSKILELNQRSRKIFKLIVDDFLKDGSAVGSRKLSIKMGEKLSRTNRYSVFQKVINNKLKNFS